MRLKVLILILLTALFSGCRCPYNFLPNDNPPPLPCFSVPKKIKVALVLGSGGVRGMVHVGVIEELEKAGIQFDLVVGCSAGSIVGALYCDCPDANQIKCAVRQLRTNSILDINLWQCRFGLSQGKALKNVLECQLQARTFDELKIPLVIVATDLNSGELVPIGNGDLIKAVQASCSIPLVFVPVELHGRTLVDGGVINTVPVCVAKDLGADLIIAVDLRELLPHTFPKNLFGVAKRSTEIAFMWQNDVCCRHADVIIRPTLCNVGIFDDSKLEMLYEAGKVAAQSVIPRIKELVASKSCPESDSSELPRIVTLAPYYPE